MNHDSNTPVKGDILIVDDDLPSLNTLSSMLTTEVYEVRGVPDGPMALTVIENKPPELILLDVKMPGMDGFEVCQHIKANEESSGIPILFLSALDEVTDKVKGFEAGAVDFITKPFQAEEVLARVDTHLTLSRLRNKLEQQVDERTAELADSEERYRIMVETSPMAIMAVRDGCIFFPIRPVSGCWASPILMRCSAYLSLTSLRRNRNSWSPNTSSGLKTVRIICLPRLI